jgi:hypothetical protein
MNEGTNLPASTPKEKATANLTANFSVSTETESPASLGRFTKVHDLPP